MTTQLQFDDFKGNIERHAVFSDDRKHRYTLERYWDRDKPHVLFVLLNPSIANAIHDDPTNRRGIDFARRWGFGGVVFCNLFTWRTPYPPELLRQDQPIGKYCDHHLLKQAHAAAEIIVAWGAHGSHLNRDLEVADLLSLHNDFELHCLGTTNDGHPKHILYLRKDTPREQWSIKAKR